MNYTLLGAVLAYEVIVIVGLGLWLQRRRDATAKDEFALARRSLSMPVVAVTLALTVLGGPHILGVFEMAWILGAAAVWFSLAHVILLVVVCLGTGVWLRRIGVATVPQLLQMSYGIETRLLVSCVMAGVLFGILTVEAQGIGIIFASLTDWDIPTGAVVGGVLGILYVILAGINEIGVVNLVNAVVMYVGLILAVIVVALNLPGRNFDSVEQFYLSAEQAHMLSIFGNTEIMMTFVLGTLVAVIFSQGINQMLLQPAMAAKDDKTIMRALWIAAPVNGLFGVFAVVLGLTAKSIPEFQALGQKVAATSMLVAYLPNWLAAILLAAFLAAILSTFAMISLAIATIFSHDIYRNLYRPDADERRMTLVMRIVIVLVAGTATGVASFLPPILAAMNWLFAWLVPVFWVLVFGLFWRCNQRVAITTLLASWIANSVWSFSDLPVWLGMAGTPNAFVTVFVAIGILVVGNLVRPGRPGFLNRSAAG
ncbi:MAG: sodium:solute symporter family protein [Rhodospirillaceae bacterium]|nr:sodium:solute symporter family protein [Rhodospirillaceae bacterium]